MKFAQGYTVKEILRYLDSIPLECFKSLGCLVEEERDSYIDALEHFKNVNSKSKLNGINKDNDNAIKGKALEDLVVTLFKSTGGYFRIYKNLKNNTNELDVLVCYTDKAKSLSSKLDPRYSKLLCECKNYNTTVKVTYVGKFCHLMQCTSNNIGIFFSYYGLAGKNWGSSVGLTKKIYLMREKKEDKLYILDFKLKDFDDILNGKSIFQILDDKCLELELGLDDIMKYIVKHPNQV
ncbi:MAG: hypothetical protein KH366_13200 [Clostridiaceae bacterium]|nr:hypothetical protein [Clostridiaceae bacterium]